MLLFAASAALAAPAELVAHPGPSPWPEPIDSPAAFDRASRGEILVFAAALADAVGGAESTASVEKVSRRLLDLAFTNYRTAAAACVAGEGFCDPIAGSGALVDAGRALPADLPATFLAWHAGARAFYRTAAAEMVRLAAIFPQVSSEIDTYSSVERDGFELSDRHFLLTFDDGPTAKGGGTDILLPLLRAHGLHAVFYLVGETLEARLKTDDAVALQALYAGQCTGVHGWRHLSHATWSDWQSSVIAARDLNERTFPDAYRRWFRPPYGERRADSGSFFQQQRLQVALWNINSQDWRESTSAEDVEQYVARLMLVWRRGVIVMHDTLPKAAIAVPWLVGHYRGAGIVWDDCRSQH